MPGRTCFNYTCIKETPFQLISAWLIKPNTLVHCVHLVPRVAAWFSVASNRVFLNTYAQNACFGREKEASDLAPKASADLSDFLDLNLLRAISVPFARENLHLVIFWFSEAIQ